MSKVFYVSSSEKWSDSTLSAIGSDLISTKDCETVCSTAVDIRPAAATIAVATPCMSLVGSTLALFLMLVSSSVLSETVLSD